MEPTKELIYNNDTNKSKIQIYNKRSESYTKSNTSGYGQDTNGLRVLKINDGVDNPAQAKPEG